MGEALKQTEYYTYEDYASWGEDVRCELIDGVVYDMASPTVSHQRMQANLLRQFSNFLDGKPCEAFLPLDVRLNYAEADDTVVQPDLVVICDPQKIENGKNCQGAPDLAIEILSPGTSRYDRVLKFQKYLQAGVREYWIVDPIEKTVDVNILYEDLSSETGRKEYRTICYGKGEAIPVAILEGLEIRLD